MKGFVWRWMVALCVFPEIVAAQIYRPKENEMKVTVQTCSASSISEGDGLRNNEQCTLLFDGKHDSWYATRWNNCKPTNQSHISFILQQSYIITKMVLYPQASCCGDRMHDVQVIFDGEVVDRVLGYRNTSVFVNTTRSRGTRNVTLYREVTEGWQCEKMGYPSIMLYEVEVYSCKQGYWGDNCETCGKGCEKICNAKNGTCDCKVGWKPPRCEACVLKKWGPSCDKDCAAQCAECKDSASNCLGCIEKYWGDSCEKSCPQNCQGPCKKTDGQCEVTPPPSEKKFPMWAAALIALGILGLIALLVCLLCLACRKRRKDQGPVQDPEGGPEENPEGEKSSQEEQSAEDSENEKSSQEEQSAEDSENKNSSRAEQSAEGTEESQQPEQAAEGGEAAPAE